MKDNGLDRETGLKYCGSEDLYDEILSDFYRLIDDKADKIENLLAEGNIQDYVVEVHALKSTARMVGAMDLSEAAFDLEMAGKADETDKLKEKTPDLVALYRSFKEKLSYLDEERGSIEKVDVDPSSIIEQLDRIIAGLLDFDIDAADEAMSVLVGYKMPTDVLEKECQRLELLLRDVDIDGAKDLAEEIRRQL